MIKKQLFILLFLLIGYTNNCFANDSLFVEYSQSKLLMGSEFIIKAIDISEKKAQKAVEAAFQEVERIENLISSWSDQSQTYLINQNAGIQPVKVDVELFNLIERCIKISELTDGMFDISYASIDAIWKFDGSQQVFPSHEEIAQSVSKIDYRNIELKKDSLTVFLKEDGMKIGFGAIGKGYAANKGKHVMIKQGINNGVVNAGGDLITWGKTKGGKEWSIGIADPNNGLAALSYFNITNKAVVTSGNYERYIELDGKKYCHIIHPNTGWPVEGMKSVTIIYPDAEVADALATAVFVMGVEDGLALINQLKDAECILIDAKDEMYTSINIELEIEPK